MASISVTECRGGRKLLIDGNLFVVLKYEHHKPGKGRTVVRLKMKNIQTGNTLDRTFSHSDTVEEADLETLKMQYLYKEGANYVFMDLNSYEQHEVDEEILGDQAHFLLEETEVMVTLFEGNPIGLDLPQKMEFTVTETTDAVRGNTATNVTKDATIETGYIVQVPLFIKVGEKIRIRTEDGSYVERAN